MLSYCLSKAKELAIGSAALLAACGGGQGAQRITVDAGDGSSSNVAARDGEASPDGQSSPLSVAAIVQPSTGLAFVSLPAAGIAAIDVAGGAIRWKADIADRPLASTGSTLVAQEAMGSPKHEIRLAIIDAATGKRTTRSEAIVAPSWVAPRPWYNGATYAFESGARFVDDDVLFFWRARSRNPCGGMPDMPCSPNPKGEGSVFRVDTSDGGVEGADHDPGDLFAGAKPAALDKLRPTIVSAHFPTSWHTAGGVLATTRIDERGTRRVLVLVGYDPDTGAELSARDLTRASDSEAKTSIVPSFSVDGRHVLVTRLLLEPRGTYERTLHDAATGAQLAVYRLDKPPTPYIESFLVAGDTLVHVARRGPSYDRNADAMLEGLAVANGAVRFTHPLRQTHGHGLPP